MHQQRMSAALAEQRRTEMLGRLVEEQLKVAVAALPGENQKCIKVLLLHFCVQLGNFLVCQQNMLVHACSPSS